MSGTGRQRVLAGLLAALVLAGVTAVDPFGFAPAGPLRATVVTVLVLVAAAVAVRTAVLPRSLVVAWGAFLLVLLVATALAVDPLHAWLGTPDRRMGWLSWVAVRGGLRRGGRSRRQRPGLLDRARRRHRLGRARGLGGRRARRRHGVRGRARGRSVPSARLPGSGLHPAGADRDRAGGDPVGAARAGGSLPGPAPRWARSPCWPPGPAARGSAPPSPLRPPRPALPPPHRSGWSPVPGRAPRPSGGTGPAARPAPGAGRECAGDCSRRSAVRSLVVAVVTPVGARALSAFGQGISSRGDEWRVGVAALLERPWVGYGPEGYRIVWAGALDAAYVERHGRDVLADRAHSGPLDVALAGGLPTLLAYAVLVALAVRAAWRSRRGEPWLAGCAAGVVGYLAQQLFLFPLLELDPLLWMLVGLLAGEHRLSAGFADCAARRGRGPGAGGRARARGRGCWTWRRTTRCGGRPTSTGRSTTTRPSPRRTGRRGCVRIRSGRGSWPRGSRSRAARSADVDAALEPWRRGWRGRRAIPRCGRSGRACWWSGRYGRARAGGRGRGRRSLEELIAADPHHPALREPWTVRSWPGTSRPARACRWSHGPRRTGARCDGAGAPARRKRDRRGRRSTSRGSTATPTPRSRAPWPTPWATPTWRARPPTRPWPAPTRGGTRSRATTTRAAGCTGSGSTGPARRTGASAGACRSASGPTSLQPPVADPAIAAALRALPLDHRAVVVCRLLLDWSVDDTAAALGVRPGTVKSRLHRALRDLETRLAHLRMTP